MLKFILMATNLGGILLVLIGVVVFANSISGKSFIIGNLKLPLTPDIGMFYLALGLILFAASLIVGKILKNN